MLEGDLPCSPVDSTRLHGGLPRLGAASPLRRGIAGIFSLLIPAFLERYFSLTQQIDGLSYPCREINPPDMECPMRPLLTNVSNIIELTIEFFAGVLGTLWGMWLYTVVGLYGIIVYSTIIFAGAGGLLAILMSSYALIDCFFIHDVCR